MPTASQIGKKRLLLAFVVTLLLVTWYIVQTMGEHESPREGYQQHFSPLEKQYLDWCAKMGKFDLCQQDLHSMKEAYGDRGIYHAISTLNISFWCLNNAGDAKAITECAQEQSAAESKLKATYLRYRDADPETAKAAMRSCSPHHIREFINIELLSLLKESGVPYHDSPAMLDCLEKTWKKSQKKDDIQDGSTEREKVAIENDKTEGAAK